MPHQAHQLALAKADRAREAHAVRRGGMRPAYHFTAPYGWLNDPNGLIQHQGVYHLFYQHNPYATHWAQMHWGHAISRDLLAWTHLPEALAPSEPYDCDTRGGCYSGSAIMAGDALTLLYTGCTHRNGLEEQTQNLAFSTDGIHFTKYPHNPVIPKPPKGGSEQFRDPKVWRWGQSYYAVLGNSMDARGCVLLYRSENLRAWAYCGVLLLAQPGQGWMWECPDFFPLGNRWMLTVSAMGVQGNRNLWFVGEFDDQTGCFTPLQQGFLDVGDDFYAPQSFLDEHNRRIMIGWADHKSQREGVPPDAATASHGFCGHLCLPRVVTLAKGDTPRFAPIPEVTAYRINPLHGALPEVPVQPVLLGQWNTTAVEALLLLDFQHSSAQQVTLAWQHDPSHATTLVYDRAAGMLRLDRNQTDEDVSGVVEYAVGAPETLALHIFFDRNSLELFIQDGACVLSANVFPKENALQLRLSAQGGQGPRAVWDLWEIKPCTPRQNEP